ncbi:hypothetical protein AB1Y20_015678 [Prymnesium parvum]|uniref:SHSP domain-containing protein n=1 Tax=Prymnesium parvum TaxID=97485 RepID=A0AB34K3P7_PRYPA
MLAAHHPLSVLLTPIPLFPSLADTPHLFQPAFQPRVAGPGHELLEAEKEYRLEFPLPGMRPRDLAVEVQHGVLSINGNTATGSRHLTVSHQVRLPHDVDVEAAVASSENGLLSVVLPKRPLPALQLPVHTSSDALPATEGDYVFSFVLPGVRPSDLKLSCEDGLLTVEGKVKKDDEHHQILRRRWLPDDGDVEKGIAVAENGIVTVHLPKKPQPEKQVIQVSAPLLTPVMEQAAGAQGGLPAA